MGDNKLSDLKAVSRRPGTYILNLWTDIILPGVSMAIDFEFHCVCRIPCTDVPYSKSNH